MSETVLRRARKSAGLTINAVSRLTGLDDSRLSRLECRQERIWKGDIRRLSEVIRDLPPADELLDSDRLARIAPDE